MAILVKKQAAAPAAPAKKMIGKVAAPAAKALPKKAVAPVGKQLPAKAGGVAKKALAPTKKGGATRHVEEDGDGAELTSGWGGAERTANSLSSFAKNLRLKDGEEAIFRFLQDAPYANVKVHWLDKKGRASYICLGRNCPLCAIGERPRGTFNFNVAKLTDSEPIHISLDAGVKLFKQIQKYANDPRHKPLPRKWYKLERTGSGQNDTTYKCDVIREADLKEEYPELYLPTEEELADMQSLCYSLEETIKPQKLSHNEMQKVADEMNGNYERGGADDEDER